MDVPVNSVRNENEMINRYITRIDSLERDKEYIEKEFKSMNVLLVKKDSELEKLINDNNSRQQTISKLEELNKNIMDELEEMKKEKQLHTIESSFKETQLAKELQSKLIQKDAELLFLYKEKAIQEESYCNQISNLQENNELLKEKLGNLNEYKEHYNKLKESIRDFELLKENLKDYENTQKELALLQSNHNSLISQILEKDEKIKLLHSESILNKRKCDEKIILNEKEYEKNRVKINKLRKSLKR